MTLNMDKSTWKRVAFADVVRNVNRTTKDPESLGIDRVVAMEHMDPGELRIERWGDVSDGTTFTRRVAPGQTLFGKRRAYQRKVAYAEFEAICSGDIYTFEAIEGELLPTLLPFLVQSEGFFDHALGTSAGSLSPRTNWRDLANFEFDLPPINEQERIADLLWAVERHALSLRTLGAATAGASAAHLDHVLEEVGEETPLGDVVAAIIDCAHQTAPTDESNYARVIGTPDVRDGKVDLRSARPVSQETWRAWTARAVPQAGDLIFTREAPAGEVGIVPTGGRVCLGQRTVLIQPHGAEDGHLIWAVLRSRRVQSRIQVKSAGSTVPHLNVADIRSLPVPWMSTESGQRRVRESVGAQRIAQDGLALEVSSLVRLRISLLSDIFGGN